MVGEIEFGIMLRRMDMLCKDTSFTRESLENSRDILFFARYITFFLPDTFTGPQKGILKEYRNKLSERVKILEQNESNKQL
jgi:hypothetical protein